MNDEMKGDILSIAKHAISAMSLVITDLYDMGESEIFDQQQKDVFSNMAEICGNMNAHISNIITKETGDGDENFLAETLDNIEEDLNDSNIFDEEI